MRNLKTKDYLGKARLVAASDRSNAFTGFAGSEIKAGQIESTARDDRPVESLSFAAQNLVKPGLQSRRQQSEPPTNRNVFPPTPPPENDKPAQMSRGASVRNGPKPMPAKLNLDKARQNDRYEKTSPEGSQQQQRRPSRSASAQPSRGFSQREAPRRRRDEEEESYNDDLYDMYGTGGPARNSRGQRSNRGQAQYIEEEGEGSDYDDASFDEGDFEMLSNRRPTNSISATSRTSSKRGSVRQIRVKVHSCLDSSRENHEVRYIVVGPAVEFPDLVDRIREKFGIRRRFKIKIREEDSDEKITIGDQEDLNFAIQTATDAAKRQRQETGKMEVSYQRFPHSLSSIRCQRY